MEWNNGYAMSMKDTGKGKWQCVCHICTIPDLVQSFPLTMNLIAILELDILYGPWLFYILSVWSLLFRMKCG